MKHILFFLLFLVMTFHVKAQSSITPIAGITFAKGDAYGAQTVFAPGFVGGLKYTFNFSETFAIGTGIKYSQFNAKTKVEIHFTDEFGEPIPVNRVWNRSYLSAPITFLAGIKPTKWLKLSAGAGINFNYLLHYYKLPIPYPLDELDKFGIGWQASIDIEHEAGPVLSVEYMSFNSVHSFLLYLGYVIRF